MHEMYQNIIIYSAVDIPYGATFDKGKTCQVVIKEKMANETLTKLRPVPMVTSRNIVDHQKMSILFLVKTLHYTIYTV